MLRTIRDAVTVVVAAAAVAVAAPGTAGAGLSGATQLESATLVTLQDISQATLDSGESGGEGTCTNPVVEAAPASPEAHLVIAETYDVDLANAVGHCVSYQGGSATATLSVWFEHQPYAGAAFVPAEGCPPSSVTTPAFSGVHAVVARGVTCRYTPESAGTGRPHRAHAVLTYGGRSYHGYSAAFLGV